MWDDDGFGGRSDWEDNSEWKYEGLGEKQRERLPERKRWQEYPLLRMQRVEER